ncbi:hypothetical protein [Pseudonocardia spinosispora]|uniref:hypothetical protein n=1 Tax=Pseudonocardia spinosispora TaxID=103441 RepID=UPI000400CAE5|nr:hypothetical protein [Pseudonocardia spinosispora]
MHASMLDKAAVTALERLGTRLWGFPPNLMKPMVSQLGPVRALWWFARNMPRYQRTLRVLGPLRTHLLCVTISLLNGCAYCSHGHTYAFELVFLREHGKLFQRCPESLETLCGLPPAEIRMHMLEAAQQAGLHDDVRWVDRAMRLTLSPGQRPTETDDLRVAHLVRMFGVLNRVTIADKTPPDEAHDPINKDEDLKRHYQELQAETP